MLRFAREHLHPQFGARVPLVAADLQDLPFDGAFDGIVSTAAFHWVLDHDRLFRGLHRALRPGGWLQAQCGDGANLDRLRERMRALAASTPYAPFLAGYPEPWLYQDAEGAAATLQRAGFVDVQTNLESAPTVMEDRTRSMEFVSTVIVRTYLERIPDAGLRRQYVAQLADQAAADDPLLRDYWRLNLSARKP